MHFLIATIFAAAIVAVSATPSRFVIGDALSISNAPANSSTFQGGLCLAQTNAARAQNGLRPFETDTRLETSSRNHNDVMVSQDCFSHQCPGEPNFADRITAAGYSWSGAAENIAAGYADCNAVVEGWMNSPGHRANILGNFVHVGCHMAPCSGCSYTPFWTCNYASPF